ncbi:MAG: efflux transporter SaoE [Bacillota bacterium]
MKATISGALLPFAAVALYLRTKLYYSGAYIGNVLAFMIATPIINPAAVLLALATLGKELTFIYVTAGICIPILVGTIANIFGKEELIYPHAVKTEHRVTGVSLSLKHKLLFGLKWGFNFLGKEISKYVVPGILLAAFILTVIPISFIQKYLSSPDLVSIIGATGLGAIMYVCAVGHIPFVAALVGAGASPGIAITFLLTGTATNLPELISIFKLMGKRTMIIFSGSLVILSIGVGYLANILLTDFVPVFDISVNQGKLELAKKLNVYFPVWAEVICALLIIILFLWNYVPGVQGWLGEKFVGRKIHEEI